MSLPQKRAADRERKAARILGTKRVVRKKEDKNKPLPDAEPFEIKEGLGTGDWVQPEVKNGMKRVPQALVNALDQAKGYSPEFVPLAVFSDVGGTDIGCVYLTDLARYMGVLPEDLLRK